MMPTPTIAPAVPRYRQILKRELPAELLKPDNLHLLWFIPHFLIIGLSYWALSSHFSWWLAPILGLFVGHSFAGMAFIAHETCHGGAIKNRKLRHFLTGIAFSPFGIGAHLWSRWHNAEHHGHTQHPELDPDRLFMIDEYKEHKLLKWLYRRSHLARNLVIFGFFSMMMTQHNITVMMRFLRDPDATPKERTVILFQFLAPKLFWIGFTLFFGWEVLVMGYVLPLLAANAIVISYISTNHFLNPLADESDVLGTSLSVTLPKWLGWLDAMHGNFGAHVAHHLFPQAPSRHARRIEAHIAELWPDRYHVMPFSKALKLLWKTPWVYTEDGVQLVDPGRDLRSPTLGNGL